MALRPGLLHSVPAAGRGLPGGLHPGRSGPGHPHRGCDQRAVPGIPLGRRQPAGRSGLRGLGRHDARSGRSSRSADGGQHRLRPWAAGLADLLPAHGRGLGLRSLGRRAGRKGRHQRRRADELAARAELPAGSQFRAGLPVRPERPAVRPGRAQPAAGLGYERAGDCGRHPACDRNRPEHALHLPWLGHPLLLHRLHPVDCLRGVDVAGSHRGPGTGAGVSASELRPRDRPLEGRDVRGGGRGGGRTFGRSDLFGRTCRPRGRFADPPDPRRPPAFVGAVDLLRPRQLQLRAAAGHRLRPCHDADHPAALHAPRTRFAPP